MPLPETDILTWSDLEPRFATLATRSLSPSSAYPFLLEWSDLLKRVGDVENYVTLASDLNTADADAQGRRTQFHRETQPRVSLANDALRRKLLAVAEPEVPTEAQGVLRRMRTDQEVFREENVPLEAEHQDAISRYSRITGNNLAELDGESLTIPQVERRLLEPDPAIRERAWRAWQDSRLRIAPELDALFCELLSLRRKLAVNAGLPDYRSLIWQEKHRYDYTPQDCYRLHESIEREVVPFASELLERHRRALGVSTLRPWDFYWRAQVDPHGQAPLSPFGTTDELETTVQGVFAALDPELGRQFGEFRRGYMDLGSRPNKMTHAYCAAFPTRGMPYVLQNVVGTDGDVRVTLHEFGHAFHGYASMRDQPLVWNGFSAMEFVEVPSQAMEVLALPYLHRNRGGFYSDTELARVNRNQVSQIVHLLTWIGFMDALQHWLYAETTEAPTIPQIDAKARELVARFLPQTDWTGLTPQLAKVWHYHHIFTSPFYYIEYGLSWLGALQLWRQSLRAPQDTLAGYRAALTLGDSRPVPALFEAAGIRFAFDRETVRELMGFLRERLQDPA